jgi:hypothetical protein
MTKPRNRLTPPWAERRKDGFVRGHEAACRPQVAEHQRTRDGSRRWPPDARSKDRRQSGLHVQAADGVLHITDDRFDLDDEHRRSRGMQPQDVHASAVTVVIEAHLDPNLPTERVEQLHGGSYQRRVIGIHEAVQLLAPPSDDELTCGFECLKGPHDRPDPNAGKVAALDARDELSGHGRPLREIGLAPSTSPPEMPNRTREIAAQHAPMVTERSLPAAYPTIGRLVRCLRRPDGLPTTIPV